MHRSVRAILLATCVLTVPAGWAQSTLHVPGDHADIKTAIAFAQDGDTILVAPGTYTGANNRDISLYGKRITLRSSDGPVATVINAGAADRVFHIHHGEGRDTVIEGFTISNGYIPGGGTTYGGGILIEEDSGGGESSPTFRNCIIRFSYATYGGGAAVRDSSDPLFDSCVFHDNEATENGGALDVQYYVDAWNTEFIGNHGNFGGAVSVGIGITSYFLNCRFVQNDARFGGAVFAASATGTRQVFRNCLFKDNDAKHEIVGSNDGRGGAVYGGASAVCHFCTFISNYAPTEGHTAYSAGGTMDFHNSILWDSTSSTVVSTSFDMFYSDTRETGLVGSPTNYNFSQPPEFVVGPGPDGSYYLSPISPCVNAGNIQASDYCGIGAGPGACLDMATTRTDLVGDSGVADIGFHYFNPIFYDGFETGDSSQWSLR